MTELETATNMSMWKKFLAGEITRKQYKDFTAKNLGFKDFNDYNRNYLHKVGVCNPLNANRSCTLFLGVHVAERVLAETFREVQRMPINNAGFAFICNKGYKIEVKSSCLGVKRSKNKWGFQIEENKIADYFMLIAFDNRTALNPIHIWFIPSHNFVRGRIFNTFKRFVVTDGHTSDIERYEKTDRLEKTRSCCNKLKQKQEE